MKSEMINTINMVINYNNINNNNNNMRRDGGTLISIDDFDIDYSVFPISNRQIDATWHEQALARQEEGRVPKIEYSSAYPTSRQGIERSRRAVTLIRMRLNLSSSNDGSKTLPLTPEAFQVHLRLKRAKATLLNHFQLKHQVERKAAAIKAAQDACYFKMQRAEAKRRLALLSAAAAAVGRSRVRSNQHQRQALSVTGATSSCGCGHLSYEDVCKMSTVQLLGLLSELRDLSCDDMRYAIVQGELGARSMETHTAAFHFFLQCEEDKATRAIAESRAAFASEASTDTEQLHHGQRLAKEKNYEGYVAENDQDVASRIGEHSISNLKTWDPPLLPALRKHVERLPINTPSQFYEYLQAMNEFKTEQQARRRSAIFRWVMAGIMFALVLIAIVTVGLPINNSLPEATDILTQPSLAQMMPTIPHSAILTLPMNSTMLNCSYSPKAGYSRMMIYSSVELLFQQTATRIAPTVAENTELESRSVAADDPIQVKIMFFAEPCLSGRPLSMTDRAANVGHRTMPTSNSIWTDSYSSSHSFRCVQVAERYDSMACASVELLLPPWAYQHFASTALSTIKNPGAIVIFQQAATWKAPNVAESTELERRSVAADDPIQVEIMFFAEPCLSGQPLSMMDRAANIGHRTMPTRDSIWTDSYSSSRSFSCVQVTERYDSMAHASVELLLPPWAFWNPASIALSTIISPGAIVIFQQATASVELLLPPWAYRHPASTVLSTIVGHGVIDIFQQSATRISPNVAESAALMSRWIASSALPIFLIHNGPTRRFASVPTIARGAPLLPQHQHPAVPPPPEPPPGLSRGGRLRFWICHRGGVLTVAYLLESPLPPPEPPPAHSLWLFLGWVFALCCLMTDAPSLLP